MIFTVVQKSNGNPKVGIAAPKGGIGLHCLDMALESLAAGA
jgi:hypothetical protein